jgi:hypothetical protein
MKQQHRKAPSQRRYTDHHPLDGMATWSSESLLRAEGSRDVGALCRRNGTVGM